ncbi:MAG: hypothetical protein JXA30_03695 [Deltaproteobacteria bacterium]|nr:hypothetical protein [Deltaproteobacteria bacterium]
MWKVDLADLDRDGTREVLLGVWLNKRRHDEPEPHRAVWVLGWDEELKALRELWRGSALARPLRDFVVREEKLVAKEKVGNRCFETIYEWTGFGFTSNRRVSILCEAK